MLGQVWLMFQEIKICHVQVATWLRFGNWKKCSSDFVCTISKMERGQI